MDKLCGMSASDFMSKLGNSIFRINGQVFHLGSVGNEDSFGDEDEEDRSGNFLLRGQTLDTNRRWVTNHFDPDEGELQIDLAFPVIGYVNYKSGAVYMARNAERQYKIGYNHRTVKVNDRFKNERISLGLVFSEDIENNAQFVARMFDRFFFTYDQALAAVRNGTRLGAAICPQVYIGNSSEFNFPVICYKDKVVGYIDGRTNYLFPDAAYVGVLLPSSTIKEDTSDVTIRTEWN